MLTRVEIRELIAAVPICTIAEYCAPNREAAVATMLSTVGTYFAAAATAA
jgi:hypothetical protein